MANPDQFDVKDSCDDPLRYLHFLGADEGHRYFGLEIETELRSSEPHSTADGFLARLGRDYHILKWEGSCDHGFEIVTAPATLEAHVERWERVRSGIRGLRAWTEYGCGMHIHVDRRAVPNPRLLRSFINKQSNREFITYIAGREPNGYCARWDVSADNVLLERARSWNQNGSTSSGPWDTQFERSKSHAVSEDDRTFEVRIFRSTLNTDRVNSNVQFVAALAEWGHEHKEAEGTTKAFVEYVMDNRAVWPKLATFLSRTKVKELVCP